VSTEWSSFPVRVGYTEVSHANLRSITKSHDSSSLHCVIPILAGIQSSGCQFGWASCLPRCMMIDFGEPTNRELPPFVDTSASPRNFLACV